MPLMRLNGRALFYERAGHGAPVVVFLHGGLIDSRVWDSQFDWFAKRVDVIRFDLPGDGRSEAPDGLFSGIECLNGVMTQLGIERAMLVGLSGGARIAIDFAISYPAKTEKVVAVAPGLSGYDRWELPHDQVAVVRAAIRAREGDRAAEAWLDLWAPVSKGALVELGRDNASSLFAGRQLIDLEPPAIGRLSELRAPTLVVIGDKDVPDIRGIGDLIVARAPHAELNMFEGADHFPNVYDPRRFNETVVRFLGLTP
jgi:3-oxoadipate enol-lactonase